MSPPDGSASSALRRWQRRLLIAYVAALPVMVVTGVPVLGAKLQLTELIFLPLLAVSVMVIVRDGRRLTWTPLAPWLALWLAAAGVSTVMAVHPLVGALEWLAWCYLATLYLVVVNTVASWTDWRRLVTVWIIASSITALLAVIGVGFGRLWNIATPFAMEYDRVAVIPRPFWVGVGLLWASPTPNLVFGYLLAGALLALALVWAAGDRCACWAAALAVVVHAVAFGLTVSRVSIAFVFGFLVFLLRFRSYAAELLRWVVLVGWVGLVIVVEGVSIYQPATLAVSVTDVVEREAAALRKAHYDHLLPEVPLRRLTIETVYGPFSRPLLYRAAVTMWRERPLFGIGPGGFASHLFERQQAGERWNGLHVGSPWDPHSTYFGALAEIGLVGGLALLAMLTVLMRQAIQAVRRERSPRVAPLLWAVAACLAGYLVAAADDDLLTKRWLWCAAGLAGSAWTIATRGVEPAHGPGTGARA